MEFAHDTPSNSFTYRIGGGIHRKEAAMQPIHTGYVIVNGKRIDRSDFKTHEEWRKATRIQVSDKVKKVRETLPPMWINYAENGQWKSSLTEKED